MDIRVSASACGGRSLRGLARQVCVGVDGGGDVGAPVRLGCPAFPVGHRPHLRHLLQRADANPPHLLRLGLEAPHQFPLPVPRGFDDVQRQATGELFFGGGWGQKSS